MWGSWPWAGIASRHVRALTAVVVSLGGVHLLMLAFEGLLHMILPSFVKDTPDCPFALETAQLGVFIALCSLIAGLIFPAAEPANVLVSRVVWTAVVLLVGVVSHLLFIRFLATTVLHFPAAKGNYGGNPLLRADCMILVVLWHAVAFGGHLTTRRSRA